MLGNERPIPKGSSYVKNLSRQEGGFLRKDNFLFIVMTDISFISINYIQYQSLHHLFEGLYFPDRRTEIMFLIVNMSDRYYLAAGFSGGNQTGRRIFEHKYIICL